MEHNFEVGKYYLVQTSHRNRIWLVQFTGIANAAKWPMLVGKCLIWSQGQTSWLSNGEDTLIMDMSHIQNVEEISEEKVIKRLAGKIIKKSQLFK